MRSFRRRVDLFVGLVVLGTGLWIWQCRGSSGTGSAEAAVPPLVRVDLLACEDVPQNQLRTCLVYPVLVRDAVSYFHVAVPYHGPADPVTEAYDAVASTLSYPDAECCGMYDKAVMAVDGEDARHPIVGGLHVITFFCAAKFYPVECPQRDYEPEIFDVQEDVERGLHSSSGPASESRGAAVKVSPDASVMLVPLGNSI